MEKDMNQYLSKAEVLIEALPYIQRFNRKIIVIKYGGSAMMNDELKKNVIADAVLLKLVGFKPIIVHGGGKEISRWVNKVGMEARFVNGLRVTDAPTMEIAEMVLNKVNKSLVQMVQELGVKAVGISGKDGKQQIAFGFRHFAAPLGLFACDARHVVLGRFAGQDVFVDGVGCFAEKNVKVKARIFQKLPSARRLGCKIESHNLSPMIGMVVELSLIHI